MLLEYFRRNGFHSPDNHLDGPFQCYFDTRLGWHSWFEQHRLEAEQFHSFMTGLRDSKRPWCETFPADEVVYEDINAFDGFCIVDVEGGYGYNPQTIRLTFRSIPRRLILEDQNSVTGSIPMKLAEGLGLVDSEFFQPQPVKGTQSLAAVSIVLC